MLIKNEQKEITKTINNLFSKPDFFKKLCEHSNNEITLVISNLSKIINYYLVSKDIRISYTIENLLKRANQVTETNPNILFSPNTSFYLNYLKLNGINPYISINLFPKIDLESLDKELSLYPTLIDDNYTPIYSDIEQAIKESFSCPNILFKSILKQPKGMELPLVVGTKETNYYQSILDIRLKNSKPELLKTNATIGKKAINGIIGKDSVIVLFPRTTKLYSISDKDIKDNITGLFIPPTLLSFIRIPSIYKLLSICASNKQLRSGELLDINTGQEYTLPKQRPDTYVGTQYSRYEKISVTDLFEYTNTEFTGDINYDIDLIYGQLDSNKSRETALQNVSKNIAEIKQRDDIIVRKVGNKYEIRNGRHRILYVKHFYVSNYKEYLREGRLQELQRYVTIPMNVESSIEDKTANEYLLKIYTLHPQVNFYKTDINNDHPNIIVTLYNRIYSLPNTQSIIEFYNYISKSIYDNKFLIGENDISRSKDYQKLFDYLVITIKESIFKMDLLDIIKHLFTNGITIDSIKYEVSKLNIGQLYASYTDLQHTLQLKRLFNTKKDIIKSTENKYKIKEVGFRIMDIIHDNPEYIELTWDELYQILITCQELSNYDQEFLKDAADYAGYQKLKLEFLLADIEYTKTQKL